MKFLRIKEHIVHLGNKRADWLAREAVNLEHKIQGVKTPYSHFKTQLDEVTYKLWTDEWINHPNCRLSKNVYLILAKLKVKKS